MRRWLLAGLVSLGVLVCAGAAGAADGDACASSEWSSVGSSGSMKAAWCIRICDDKTSDDCSDLNLDSAGVGLAHVFSFEIGTNNDCSGGTATFSTTPVSGGQSHDLGSTTAISVTGTTRLMVDQRVQPVSEILETSISGLSGCTNGLDILLVGYVEDTR